MSKLFVQVERVEDLIGRADNYFNCDFCGKDSVDATAFAYAEKKKPITNADRLRSMTDEELAEWLAEVLFHCSNTICDERCPMYKCCCDQSSDNIEDWLKEEVSE